MRGDAVRGATALLTAFALIACSGGGSAPAPGGGQSGGGTGTTSPPATSSCTLRARQDWAFRQINEWYLFPETLPAGLDPSGFTTLDAYVDALTATARAQGRDRFFTYVASIAEEQAFFSSGRTAAFGIRIQTDTAARTVTVADAFEGAPALAAGLDRGTRILAIGTSASTLRPVPDIIAAEGSAGVSAALGPSEPGVTRTLEIEDGNGRRTVTVTKANFDIPPVSARFGAQIIEENGRRVGYINLRTFIDTADPALRQAFARFRAAGVGDFIIDFRYNGGGLVDIAELMGDLLGANRAAGDVFSLTEYRQSKAQFNETRRFRAQPESVAPVRIAFITTSASASASELVTNGMLPWLGNELVLVGANSSGKPVGQIARDLTACDDRLRIVAFATRNANGRGDYFDGLASVVGRSCAATDLLDRQMGDPAEALTRAALDALAGGQCTPIESVSRAQALGGPGRGELARPERPTTAQREVPGLF